MNKQKRKNFVIAAEEFSKLVLKAVNDNKSNDIIAWCRNGIAGGAFLKPIKYNHHYNFLKIDGKYPEIIIESKFKKTNKELNIWARDGEWKILKKHLEKIFIIDQISTRTVRLRVRRDDD